MTCQKKNGKKPTAPSISGELQSIRDKLKEIERTAENAINEFVPFSFADFEKDFIQNNNLFRQRKLKPEVPSQNTNEFDYSSFYKKFPLLLQEHKKPGTISISYLAFIKKVVREGRICTGINYHCSYI